MGYKICGILGKAGVASSISSASLGGMPRVILSSVDSPLNSIVAPQSNASCSMVSYPSHSFLGSSSSTGEFSLLWFLVFLVLLLLPWFALALSANSLFKLVVGESTSMVSSSWCLDLLFGVVMLSCIVQPRPHTLQLCSSIQILQYKLCVLCLILLVMK